MAAVWKGTISFGLVTIPVELQSAVIDHRPHFRMLHDKDKSPVRYERVCRREDKPVAWDDLVKGYEYEKGKFIILTKEDFQKAAVEKTRSIDILDFVEGEQIDDRYFDRPYYVLAGKDGERAYALLRGAMRATGRIGIGKIVLREEQHLVALSVVGEALVLTLLRFADELVDESRFSFPSKSAHDKELALAKSLVESLAGDWKPDSYTDEYRLNLLRVIKAKMKGKEPRLIEEKPQRSGDVVDLMERLRESLATGKRGASKRKAAGKRAKASRRAA